MLTKYYFFNLVCAPFLDWKSRCRKTFWGSWVGCPCWDNCKWKSPDLICVAGCEIERCWNQFVEWVEQVGIKVGD